MQLKKGDFEHMVQVGANLVSRVYTQYKLRKRKRQVLEDEGSTDEEWEDKESDLELPEFDHAEQPGDEGAGS